MLDLFTKWVEAKATRDTRAMDLARKLPDEWFFRFGAPKQLHNDQEANLNTPQVQDLCHRFRVLHTRTTQHDSRSGDIYSPDDTSSRTS